MDEKMRVICVCTWVHMVIGHVCWCWVPPSSCDVPCPALPCCQWSSLLSRSEVSIPPTSGKSQHKPTSVSSLRSPFSLFIDWTISVFFDQSLNHDDAWNVICWQSNEVFITIGLDSERETHHNGHYPVLVLHDAGHCCSHSADICSKQTKGKTFLLFFRLQWPSDSNLRLIILHFLAP